VNLALACPFLVSLLVICEQTDLSLIFLVDCRWVSMTLAGVQKYSNDSISIHDIKTLENFILNTLKDLLLSNSAVQIPPC